MLKLSQPIAIGEHLVGQQIDVLGEHAEDKSIDEMRDRFSGMPTIAQALRQLRKFSGCFFGQRLSGLARLKALRIRKYPLELLPDIRIAQVIKAELVNFRNAVGPVGMNSKPIHIAHDQQRWVLQRERVLLKLGEGSIEVFTFALVFPAEVIPPPYVGPAFAAGGLGSAPFERIPFARRIDVRRCRFVQHPA